MNIIIQTCAQGILSINLPFIEEGVNTKDSIFGFLSELKIRISGPHLLGKTLARELESYFQGDTFHFSAYPLIWHEKTTFKKRVLSGLEHVPYGKTLSYSELARIIGCPNAVRAVGQALKKNPWPILLPCHRIIGKNGKLRGFSSGCAWKKILLTLEQSAKEAYE